ncbi:MAG: diacylglycerol kinase [Cyanobacteria bacterium SW_9_44_58]|nr:MAG: diacylglycerol kinase [Cyanobacteria bacterium SW_9_44_58]
MRANANPSVSNQTRSNQQGDNHLTLVSKPSPHQTAKRSISSNPSFGRQFAFKIAPDLLSSFRYAFAGVRYTFATQRNFRIHTVIGSIAIGLGVFLEIAAVKMAVIGITIAFVLALELLNTALESVVDLTVKQSYHELAKVAKDCAAGAVLIGALVSLFVASIILLPPLLKVIIA